MNAGKPGRGADQFPLRLPDGMRDRIKQRAAANNRSMNAEIVSLLEEALVDEIFKDSEELKTARAAHQAESENMTGFYKIPSIVSGEELDRLIRKALAETLERAGVVRERVEVDIKDDKDGK